MAVYIRFPVSLRNGWFTSRVITGISLPGRYHSQDNGLRSRACTEAQRVKVRLAVSWKCEKHPPLFRRECLETRHADTNLRELISEAY
jgi:hypothetical protein